MIAKTLYRASQHMVWPETASQLIDNDRNSLSKRRKSCWTPACPREEIAVGLQIHELATCPNSYTPGSQGKNAGTTDQGKGET